MLIKRETLERIRKGEITLQFRRWQRRTVKPGGTLKTSIGLLGIGDIREADPASLTDADARCAGFIDAAALGAWLDAGKPGRLERIEIRYLGEDPRLILRRDADLSPEELSGLVSELDLMDRRSGSGPWTGRALTLIANHPGRAAAELALEMGEENLPFKSRIRKLKVMGLTESLKTGYRLSPRGEKVHGALKSR